MKKELLLVALFFTLPAFGQQTYGTASESVVMIPEQAFVVNDPTTTYAVDIGTWKKYVTNNAGCCLEAPLTLPEGALITGIEAEGCDTTATAEVTLILGSCAVPGVGCVAASPTATSGFGATPGCGTFRANLSPALAVNNATHTYFVQSTTTNPTGLTTLRAARVYYKLQVSPAPATATFADVPTSHVFFQYIEALAASGITSGCTSPPNPNYCPDAPLTRGQMAVFLSKALGLHFAP